jgi:serine/threonine-protein kinase RsbW
MPKSQASTLSQQVPTRDASPEQPVAQPHELDGHQLEAKTRHNSQSGGPHVITLSIPALSDYVRVARLAVTGVASRMRFSYDEVEDIKLAVSEACNNAILHAVPPSEKPDALPQVTVELIPHDDRLEICVSDEGFVPPPGLPAPRTQIQTAQTAALNNEDSHLPESGLGLMLIQTLMDEVSHHTSPVDRTSVRMIKRVRH